MAIRFVKDIWAMIRQKANNDVWDVVDTGSPVNGTTGTGAGFLGPGSTYVNATTGIKYANIGTKLSPIWMSVDSAVTETGGIGVAGNAKMTYDFAVDGGVQGLITPTNSPTIPNKAIILGGVIDITTTLTSGGSATIALGTSAGSSASALKTATAVATWAAGVTVPVTPVFTAATYVKLTAAGRLTLTVATADLTAGKFDVNVIYVIGN
jgi:hypothetical protein